MLFSLYAEMMMVKAYLDIDNNNNNLFIILPGGVCSFHFFHFLCNFLSNSGAIDKPQLLIMAATKAPGNSK